FLDIVRFVTASSIPYEDVKAKYLFNDNTGNLSQIEQIFFLYAFILMHFVPSQNKSVNEKIDKWLRPALKDMEACVEQFKRDEFEVIIQSLLEDREAAEENIKKLKRHNTNLKKKKKKLQTE